MLEGSLPEHGGEAGSAILKFWGTLFPLLGLILLMGAVVLILWTDVGLRRSLQVSAGAFFGYIFLHSITWILSGNGPKGDGTGFWNDRYLGVLIGLGAVAIFVTIVLTSHYAERKAQRVPDQ